MCVTCHVVVSDGWNMYAEQIREELLGNSHDALFSALFLAFFNSLSPNASPEITQIWNISMYR